MGLKYQFLISIITLFVCSLSLQASNVVSDVKAYQHGKTIVITYQLSLKSDISVSVSTDGGNTYVPIKSVTGDVGSAVYAGSKKIIWHVLEEYDGFVYSDVMFKVTPSGSYVKKHSSEYLNSRWNNIILVNGGFSSLPDYAFGLTYARVKRAGFYVSAMTNFGFKFNADYYADKDISINGIMPFYSGKKQMTRIEATTGVVISMAPVYLYTGLGYGYRGLFYETISNEWVAVNNSYSVYHGAAMELGLIGDIKGFALSLGFSIIFDGSSNCYPEAKVGIGYCF